MNWAISKAKGYLEDHAKSSGPSRSVFSQYNQKQLMFSQKDRLSKALFDLRNNFNQ